MCTTLPKTHIAVMGMERIAPTFAEVDVLITMLARSAVGARLTGYNTWLTGPREADNVDGPEEFHLVIVDNGRSQVLGSEFRDVLRCIRCGACMNTCPAYRHIGGHGYGSIYPGPIGAVISPLLGGYKDFKDLPYACSLCTACDSVCPVRIPLSKLILRHRRVMAEEGITPKAERRAIKMFAYANSHPGLWKVGMMAGAHAASWLSWRQTRSRLARLADWMEARDLPDADGESFRSWFRNIRRRRKRMDNRTAFLNTIAQALGRPLRFEPQADAAPVNNYANERLTELSPEQRCSAFIQFASEVMLARCELTSEDQAADAALRLCEELGQQPVVLSGDSRLVELGITERLQQECNAVVWDPARGSENITQAEQAKVGVVYAEYGLTESGGVVLFSAPERGRSLSLLPESSIFVLRKSTILPRVAQLAEKLHQKAQAGERMPSCINIISGPSSTADIELIKVVGVHGPVKAVYLIIEDC